MAIWRKRRESPEPSEEDLATFQRMIAPGGGYSLDVFQITGVERDPESGSGTGTVAGVLRFDVRRPTPVEEYLRMPAGKSLRTGDEVAVIGRWLN